MPVAVFLFGEVAAVLLVAAAVGAVLVPPLEEPAEQTVAAAVRGAVAPLLPVAVVVDLPHDEEQDQQAQKHGQDLAGQPGLEAPDASPDPLQGGLLHLILRHQLDGAVVPLAVGDRDLAQLLARLDRRVHGAQVIVDLDGTV